MDDGGSPTLEVGFAISTGDSSNELNQLAALMDSTEAKIVREAKSIEDATKGMLNLGGQTAEISAFASTTTAAFNKAEQAAERMTARLQEQTATFGMTRAAAAAWRADQAGATDAANHLRAAEAALDAKRQDSITTLRAEALATKGLASSASMLTSGTSAAVGFSSGMVGLGRTTQGTQIEMLEMTHIARSLTEQLSTGVSPFRALASESGRFMTAVQYGGAGVSGFIKQFASLLGIIKIVQDAELAEAAATTGAQAASIQALAQRAKASIGAADAEIELALAAGRVAATDTEAAVAAARLAGAYEAQTVAATQLKVAEDALAVAQGRATEAAAASKAATSTMIGGVGALLGSLVVVAGVGFGALKQFQSQVKDSGDLTDFRDNLGLTHKEMLQLSDGVDKAGDKIKKLDDVTVTAGDVMAGVWKTIQDGAGKSDTWDHFKDGAVKAFGYVLTAWDMASAGITAGIYGTVNAAKVIWSNFASSVGDVFYQAVNLAISAMNRLVKAGTDILNGFVHAANHVPGVNIGDFNAPQMAEVANPYAGKAGQTAATAAAKQIGDGYTKAYADARKADTAFWKQVGNNSKQHAKDRMTEEANALKADRTPKAPKVDHNALNAEAIEAQIKNLYRLADAYGVSGAAALIAEAREKAESKAIKSHADIEDAVARQVRLAVAQRVADAAKSTAALNDNAAIQEQVNSKVAAGLIPASLASQVLKDQIALQPLLAAQEAARLTGDIKGYAAATSGLAAMTAAQERDNNAKRDAQYLASLASDDQELDRLKLEAQLIGATAAARVHALAQQKAMQDEQRMGYTATPLDADVVKKTAVADQGFANTQEANKLNEQLRLTAELASSAGDAMAKAFGTAGTAIGDAIKIMGDYGVKQQAIHQQFLDGKLTEEQAQKATSGLQLDSMIGLTDAAKNMFAEHSAGYEVMAATEKALAAWRAIQAVRDMAAGAAKMFASLGPLGFAAVAAMVAVMAGFGISGGGGSAIAPPSAADLQKAAGTGTVLGSVNGQSASIAHSLDLVAKNTDGLLAYSNPMLAALKTINTSIGAMTAAVAKQIGVSGSFTDTSKLNIGASGSAGFLGLFSSSTTRTLYDAGITLAATTVGNIVAQGISGQTYQVVQQVKKSSGFLGIGGGTKTTYQTTTGGLPSDITDSIRSVIGALESGIVTAAGQIGVTGAKAMLDNFQVSIGQLSFNGLDAQGISDELNAVFSKVGDQMVQAILPDVARFQQAGEGLFETLERVASTVAVADAEFRKMGVTTTSLGIDVDMAVAGMFDSVSDFATAADAYFKTFYSVADQAKSQAADMQAVFDSLGVAMPSSLEGFRQLVEAQDLTTTAGESTYATLLKVAPAFADLQAALNGAKSAADALNERDGLLNQLWQLQGDTASIRAAQLATLDPSNRALQEQLYAVQDAQDAAKAASDLADAWKSVGDSIMDEINRIRGLSDPTGNGSFASLMAQFNAATTAARSGDQDSAKNLPQLSQALLTAAATAATSRQELDRVQAQTAASLQATYNAIGVIATSPASSSTSNAALLAAAATSTAASSAPTAANDDMASAIRDLQSEVAQLRADNNAANATIAAGTTKTAKIMDQVTGPYGGQAIAVGNAAAA